MNLSPRTHVRLFFVFFVFEFKRFAGKTYMMLASLLILGLSIIFIQIGIDGFNDNQHRKDRILELERQKIDYYQNWTQYGGYGYRTVLEPDKISIFMFDSGKIPDLTSFVDSGARLRIYQPLIGANIFKARKFGFADFSGIMLVLGSLLSIFYGFFSLKSIEFMKTVASIVSHKTAFRYQQTARVLILVLVLLFIVVCGYLYVLLNGIAIPLNRYFFFFILGILLVSIFFFKLGTALGTVKSRATGVFAMFSSWFILVFLVPAGIDYFIAHRSNLIKPIYEMEMEKFKLMMNFEKRAIEEAGTFDYGKEVTEKRKNVILSYYRNEFEKMQELEDSLRLQMEKYISHHQGISSLFPTTFYLSGTSEISSRGFQSLLDYYRYVQESKKRFFRFYMENLYFKGTGDNPVKVETFVTGDEAVYKARSGLPRFTFLGVLLTIIYIVFFDRLAFRRSGKRIFSINAGDTRDIGAGSLTQEFEKAQFRPIESEGGFFNTILYTLLSGEARLLKKKKIPGKITIDGKDLFCQRDKKTFLYICHPEELPPDTTPHNLVSFIVKLVNIAGKENECVKIPAALKKLSAVSIRELNKKERFLIILALLNIKGMDVYLVNNAARGLGIKCAVHIKERMEKLKENGPLVIYLTDDVFIAVVKENETPMISDTPEWSRIVDYYKDFYNIQPLEDEPCDI